MKRPALGRSRLWLAALILLGAAAGGWWLGQDQEATAPSPMPVAPASSPRVPVQTAPPATAAVTASLGIRTPTSTTPSATTSTASSAKPPMALAPAQTPGPDKVVDIFAVRTWEPPPPPMPPPMAGAPVAPPPPQAPPLPFRFMGRIDESGKSAVFLLVQGDQVLPVHVGERVGGNYRLEKFEGGQLYFRYQPMNVVQTLAVGNPQ